MSEKTEQDKRKDQIKAQLRHTATLIDAAMKSDLDLSDDGCDYLMGTLDLSRALIDELNGGPYVDKALIRDIPSGGVCWELQQASEV